MTFSEKLHAVSKKHDSLVCVGLDPDVAKMPASVAKGAQPLFEFCKAIVDATAEFTSVFKPNSAFYEAYGAEGIEQLKALCDYIHETQPDMPILLDAKRADIGNTNEGYAAFAFDYLGVDAMTIHPYLGSEAVQPFTARADKGVVVLCRTSNPGAAEFQDLAVDGKPLYQRVAETVVKEWNKNGNCQLVVGATYPKEMAEIRAIVGDDMDILVPGIGAQGGDLEATLKAGLNQAKAGLMISASRSILYASGGDDFAQAAAREAKKLRDEINANR